MKREPEGVNSVICEVYRPATARREATVRNRRFLANRVMRIVHVQMSYARIRRTVRTLGMHRNNP